LSPNSNAAFTYSIVQRSSATSRRSSKVIPDAPPEEALPCPPLALLPPPELEPPEALPPVPEPPDAPPPDAAPTLSLESSPPEPLPPEPPGSPGSPPEQAIKVTDTMRRLRARPE